MTWNRKWTDADIERVRRLAASRMSSAKIATAMNVNRNMIIGLCTRKGIKLLGRAGYQMCQPRFTRERPPRPPREKRQVKEKTFSFAKLPKPDTPQPITHIIGDALFAGEGIPLFDVRDGLCRWPFAGHKCCGKACDGGRVYCVSHGSVAFQAYKPHNPQYVFRGG